MSPRKLLGAVPAAFTAETLSGLTANQFVRSDATSTIASSSAQTLLTLNQNGAGNVFDVKANNISLASFLANGNVGIGTSSPYARLSVAGQVVAAFFTGTSTATSTFGGGLDIASGCYAVSGVCLTSTGASSTLFADTNTFTGLNQFNRLTVTNSTTTAGTSTNFFASIFTSALGTFTNLFGTNATITNATSTKAGTYTVTVTSGSCTATATTVVTVTTVTATASNTPNCGGATLSATGGVSYAWAGPNSFTSTLQNPTITNYSKSLTTPLHLSNKITQFASYLP
jgi:hypothetical protein